MKNLKIFKCIVKKTSLLMLSTLICHFMYLGLEPDKAYASTFQLPITEGFEGSDSLPVNWHTTTTSMISWSWAPKNDPISIDPSAPVYGDPNKIVSPHDGSNGMGRASVSYSNAGDSDRLYSDSFSFPTTGFCEYSFWMYHYPDLYGGNGAADSIQPQISVDGGTSWANIGTEIKRVDGVTTGWSKYTIRLSSADYGGNNVKVGLLAYSDYGYNIYIDDISVYSTTPTNLTATAGSGQVGLSWNSVTGATGYKVYKSTTAESGYSEVDSGTSKSSNSYNVTGLINGTPYYFKVTAITATGESAYSVYASATPLSTVPEAPTNLTATAGDGQASLSWDSVTGATSYKVYKSTTAGSGYSEVDASTIKSGNNYTVTGLTNGTTYYFVVTAYKNSQESLYSNEVSALPLPPIPAAPTNLTATAGNGQVSLSWDSVLGATSYKVYKSTTAGTGYSEVDVSTLKSSNSYTVIGLSNSTPYYFVVKAGKATGESSYSNEVCSTPLEVKVPVGSGTSADPYIIDNPYGPVWMSANIATVKAGYFKQIADIDMTGVSLTPIGNSINGFTGTYDGCGRNISNLTMSSGLSDVGLFGYISSPGTVKYLTLTNAKIKGTSISNCNVGGIAGRSSGTIESCNVIGSSFIEGAGDLSMVGSLLGKNDFGTINNCYSTAQIIGHSATSSIGGISGHSEQASTQACYFAGTLTGDAATKKGGIIGNSYNDTTITDNYFLATVTTNGIGITDLSAASNTGATPIIDADLKKQDSFNNWDFSIVWYINEDNAYPVLRAPAPYARDIAMNLNPVGTNDTATVSGRVAGDIVRIYDAQTGGTLLGTATVPAAQTSVTVDFGKLAASSVYVSITSSLRFESGRTQKFPYTINVGVTSTDKGTVTGGGGFGIGERVTLGVTPKSGYNFAGWYNGVTLVSSLPNYSFVPTQDLDLTAHFETMPTGTLHVISASGGSVKLNGNGIIADYSHDFSMGTQITLTATPDSGYTFGYWENTKNSNVVATANIYRTYPGQGGDLKAVFFPIVGPFTVIFKDKSGKILQSFNDVASGEAVTPPDIPTLPGYTAKGWDNNKFGNVTSNMIITAVYQREATTYELTVGEGSLSGGGTSGNYKLDTLVTVEARAAGPAEQFSHWEQDGVKVSSKSTYTFYMPKHDTTLTAVFIDSTTVLDNTPFITLLDMQAGSNMLLVTAKQDVPTGYTLVESGVLLLQAASCDDLTLNTTEVIRTTTRPDATDQFYVRKLSISGKWYARGYLIYKDSNGNLVTVYSDNILNDTIAG